MDVKNSLLSSIQPHAPSGGSKVTIVGCGQVGMACALSMLLQRITNELCLIDVNADKAQGEMLDLLHGSMYLKSIHVSADFAISNGSRLCIITVGIRQNEGEAAINLVQRNTEELKIIVPQLVKYSPDAILLVVSKPTEILTYVTWKLSKLPAHRVIGAGTNLDSSRFRFLLSEKLGIAPTSCQGWIIGEQGHASVAVWSGVNVAGVSLKDLNPNFGTEKDLEKWIDIHKNVVDSVDRVVKLKGYMSWSIAMSVTSITNSILNNIGDISAVSIYSKGLHGVTQDVYLSLPAVLGSDGVTDIVKQPLNDHERVGIQKIAIIMSEIQAGIRL